MAGTGRTVLGLGAAAAAFAALAYPSFWLYLLSWRELLRLAAVCGLFAQSRGLGGQILGYNYYRDPPWVHAVAMALAAMAGFGPALVASIALMRRIRGSAEPTLCGACGSTLRGLAEPKCPACGAGF
jgi:hypothetical protein